MGVELDATVPLSGLIRSEPVVIPWSAKSWPARKYFTAVDRKKLAIFHD